MFKKPEQYRTFLTVVLTYFLDLVGFSIVFPVLAPLLLNPKLHYFAAHVSDTQRTTVLGILFAVFGITQFIGAPVAGVLADHYGRYKVFIGTIAMSIVGYGIMAMSVYEQSLLWMFVGRIITGFCSGNFSLAQSTTADLVEPELRSKAFGLLMGIGGLGFVAGPWFGGRLANPDWLNGSGAFIFAAAAALINLIMVYFFFTETFSRKKEHAHFGLFDTFKDIRLVFHEKVLRTILLTFLLFSIGWAFFLIFFPTYLVQKFNLSSGEIGDVYAFQSIIWCFASMYLNKELAGRFSARTLILWGGLLASVGVAMSVYPNHLWPYWIISPIAITGGVLCWINLGTLLSQKSSAHMQGRALGASGAMWSFGQILAPLVAGPLASWNIHSPLLLGSFLILITFFYFLFAYREKA
jgi:DHA1 family tetracycline resistance protein-like MFS transporter